MPPTRSAAEGQRREEVWAQVWAIRIGAPMPEPPRLEEFAELLRVTGRGADELMSVCHDDGRFRSDCGYVSEAPLWAWRFRDGNCWFGTAPLHHRVYDRGGRGRETDVVGLRTIFADLDAKAEGLRTFELCQTVIERLSALLGTVPVAIVNSGHGLQPYWSVEQSEETSWPDENDPRFGVAVALSRRFGRLVAEVARQHEGRADTVSDLSRVLRVPDSVNVKDPQHPLPVTVEFPDGTPISLATVREVCDELAVTERLEDQQPLGEQVSLEGHWAYAERSCPYILTAVGGWATDTANGSRHNWLLAKMTRLAAAHRYGCLTENDRQTAYEVLVRRFGELIEGTDRPPQPLEIANAAAFGIRLVESFTDERTAGELGDPPHAHGNDPAADVWPLRAWSDLGNGQRLWDHYGDRLRYLTDMKGVWASYDAGVWTWGSGRAVADSCTLKMYSALPYTEALHYSDEPGPPDKSGEPTPSEREKFLKWARILESRGGSDNALAMAAKVGTGWMTLREFDQHPGLLNVANGVLALPAGAPDFRVAELRPWDPELLMTKQAAARYDPSADCPHWDLVLRRQFPDDSERHWVETLLAYAALREGNYRKLTVFLWGPRDSGKSRLTEVLNYSLGGYADSFEVSLLRGKHGEGPRPDLVRRMHTRLLVTTEANDQGVLHANHLKRLTGGDTMSARALYSNTEVSGVPAWTAVLAVNSPPDVTGFDAAVRRRIIVVPFAESVPLAEQIHNLPRRLEAEADGILALLVARLADEHVLDTIPERFQIATDENAQEMSNEARFLSDETEPDEIAVVTNADLMCRYQLWAAANYIVEGDRLSADALGRAMNGFGWTSVKRWHNGRDQRVRLGRRLRELSREESVSAGRWAL